MAWENPISAVPSQGAFPAQFPRASSGLHRDAAHLLHGQAHIELVYQAIASAAAAGGSGMEALLPLPPDARDVAATGGDLVSQTKIRGENRSLRIRLGWKTRGILDRQVMLSYRMPLRPLDPAWHLQSPGGEGTRTRFIIATSPRKISLCLPPRPKRVACLFPCSDSKPTDLDQRYRSMGQRYIRAGGSRGTGWRVAIQTRCPVEIHADIPP